MTSDEIAPVGRMLDLFCGAGGAAVGYHRAWPHVEIVGVDINPQPNYPFTLFRGDVRLALKVLDLWEFDFIHASPPCQAHTTMSNRYRGQGGVADSHTDYIAEVRDALSRVTRPYVIENVPGARKMLHHPITLTGGMFGLGVERPRLFECSFPVVVPQFVKVTNPIGVYGRHHDGRLLWTRKDGSQQRAARTLAEGRDAMGIDWMEWRELAESIPPAYTEWLAGQFDQTLAAVA
jgi:DNA (cytosine-5)-methyltransferase 1